MKKFFKTNRILAFLALVGLFASLVPVAARMRAEEANKKYDILLDYASLRAMAQQSELSEGEWLDIFASLGVDKIVLGESNAHNLEKNAAIPVHAASIKTTKSSQGWENSYPETVLRWIAERDDLTDALISAETEEAFNWICNALDTRGDNLTYRTFKEDGRGFIYLPRQNDGTKGEKLLNLCLGIWPETEKLMRSHGMNIVPRTTTVNGLNGMTFAKEFIGVLKDCGSPYYINSGDSWVGYDTDDGEELFKNFLVDSGIGIGLMEEYDHSGNMVLWDGVEEILEDTDYNGVRIFNEWPFIQNRYAYCGYEGPEEITNTLFRAAAERTCKVIYFKMILEPDNDVKSDADQEKWTYITDPADYEKLLTDLDARLADLGYTHETVRAVELKDPSVLVRVIEGIGVAALLVMLADLFLYLDDKWRYGLLAAGILGMTGLAFAVPDDHKLLLSIFGGIVMPSIAGVALCRIVAEKRRVQPRLSLGRLIGYCVALGLLIVLVSFTGSILATSALSELSYMIEINLYRGVKLMQLIPIGLFGVGYLLVFAYEETGAKRAVLAHIGERGEKGRVQKLWSYLLEVLDRPMKLSWFVAVVVIALACVCGLGIGVYYILRTGNYVTVSAAELRFRDLLEQLLIARPRTKELLIGWPCLLLFIWSLRRHLNFLPLVFGLGMMIGLVSVVNTFLHIHAPLTLSLLRTGWGILFGFILGVIAVLVAELIYRFIRKLFLGSSHV